MRSRPSVLEIVGEKLAAALTKARVLEFATVPVGTGTGLTVRDFLGGFLTGFVRGLSNSKDGANFRKISICEIDAERNDAIHQEMKALSDDGFFAKLGYEIVLSKEGTPGKPARGGADAVAARPASPVYLQVQRMAETTFEYCMLAAELGAAIQLHQQTIDTSEQARAADMAAKLQQFDAATGSSLASVYVPAAMQDLICRSLEKPTAHLVIIHDQASSTIPWEAFYFKDRCPALDVGVSRLYRIANRSRGGGRPILAHDATLRMLVVENPTGDLAGAQNEGEQLAATLHGEPRKGDDAEGCRCDASQRPHRALLRRLRHPALRGPCRLRRIESGGERPHPAGWSPDRGRSARARHCAADDLPQRLRVRAAARGAGWATATAPRNLPSSARSASPRASCSTASPISSAHTGR